MTKKRKLQIIIDILMLILLPILMAYSLIGEQVHEWAGLTIFIALILHNYLNLKWHKNIPRGKYNSNRTVTTIINIILVFLMFSMMISGMLMSQYVFAFLPVDKGSSIARRVHLAAAYWFFILTSFHLGMNWNMFKGMLKKLLKIKRITKQKMFIVKCLIFIISLYGIYCLFSRGVLSYMFLQTQFAFFDFGEPLILFFFSYFSMMIFFVVMGYRGNSFLQQFDTWQRKKAKNNQ